MKKAEEEKKMLQIHVQILTTNVGNSAACVQRQDDQQGAALTLNNAGSQIRRFSERTEEAAVVDVPL